MAGEPVRGIQAQARVLPGITTQLGQQRLATLLRRVETRQWKTEDTEESPKRTEAAKLVRVPTETHTNGLPQPLQPERKPGHKPGVEQLPGRMRQRIRAPLSGTAPGQGPRSALAEARRPQEWKLGLTGRMLLDDLMRDLDFDRAQAERLVSLPVYKLSRAEVVALSNKAVSGMTRARVVRELSRVAVALERRGDVQTAAIARTMGEKLPRTVDAYAVKMLWDLANRLPRAEDRQIQEAQFEAPEVRTTGENDLIRESSFAFEHDGNNTSGYKFYFSATPPTGTEFVADHEFDAGYLNPSATGERQWHFEDAANVLNNDARYYVWVTAYNDNAESGPSNVVHEVFPAAERGDLNRDGVIDTADMDALMRILLGEADSVALADVNGDGWVTQADVEALIAKMS